MTDNITPAIDRLFRSYMEYIEDTTSDTLFVLLTALHSLDDRIDKTHGRLFFAIPEYVVLKELRNESHHGREVRYVVAVKDIGLPLTSDLIYVCLVSAADCAAAIERTPLKFRERVREAFTSTTRRYGEVVDINPCIFNCIVRIFEVLRVNGLEGKSAAFAELAGQYQWETVNEHSHYVTGAVRCLPNDVGRVAEWMAACYEAGT